MWTPSIEEKSSSLSRSIIKHETNDHEEHEDENSNLSNGTGTSSSSSSSGPSRTSPNNRSLEQHRNLSTTINHLYSEASASTPVTNINTVTPNDLQLEQYPSTHGLFLRLLLQIFNGLNRFRFHLQVHRHSLVNSFDPILNQLHYPTLKMLVTIVKIWPMVSTFFNNSNNNNSSSNKLIIILRLIPIYNNVSFN